MKPAQRQKKGKITFSFLPCFLVPIITCVAGCMCMVAAINLNYTQSRDYGARWSPNGKWIAFSSSGGFNSNVWRVDSDGKNLLNLTQGQGSRNEYPDWSPDSRFIAFTSNRSGSPADLWVMEADGSNPVNLTPDTLTTFESGARWSPDGSKIAYSASQDGNFIDVWVMDSDGSNRRNLTAENPNGDEFVTWTPDSETLIYSSVQIRNNAAYQDLRRVNIYSGAITIVRATNNHATGTAISPNWQVLFTSDESGNSDIWLAANLRDIGSARNLTANSFASEQDAAWSPNENFMVFSSTKSGRSALYMMRLSDGTWQSLPSPIARNETRIRLILGFGGGSVILLLTLLILAAYWRPEGPHKPLESDLVTFE